jgi:hypothetical protein
MHGMSLRAVVSAGIACPLAATAVLEDYLMGDELMVRFTLILRVTKLITKQIFRPSHGTHFASMLRQNRGAHYFVSFASMLRQNRGAHYFVLFRAFSLRLLL